MKKLPIFPAPIIKILIHYNVKNEEWRPKSFVLYSSLNLFLIQNFQLLANTLLVDMLKDLGSKLWAHSAE
mgnify:CR=1 FL=1